MKFDLDQFIGSIKECVSLFGKPFLDLPMGMAIGTRICPVDVVEAGFYLEHSEVIRDADGVFDLTVGELLEKLPEAA